MYYIGCTTYTYAIIIEYCLRVPIIVKIHHCYSFKAASFLSRTVVGYSRGCGSLGAVAAVHEVQLVPPP